MMDATMSNRFRQQVCFAIAAHMYVTTLLIYGWPHDSATKVADDSVDGFHYVFADKNPPWMSVRVSKHPEWMQESQLNVLDVYKYFTLAAVILTLYVWVGNRLIEGFKYMFYRVSDTVGESQNSTYEDHIASMRAYCPVIPHGNKELVFANVNNMLVEQRSMYAEEGKLGLIDLSELIPESKWSNTLSSIKYYAFNDDVETGGDYETDVGCKELTPGSNDLGGYFAGEGIAQTRDANVKMSGDCPPKSIAQASSEGPADTGSDRTASCRNNWVGDPGQEVELSERSRHNPPPPLATGSSSDRGELCPYEVSVSGIGVAVTPTKVKPDAAGNSPLTTSTPKNNKVVPM